MKGGHVLSQIRGACPSLVARLVCVLALAMLLSFTIGPARAQALVTPTVEGQPLVYGDWNSIQVDWKPSYQPDATCYFSAQYVNQPDAPGGTQGVRIGVGGGRCWVGGGFSAPPRDNNTLRLTFIGNERSGASCATGTTLDLLFDEATESFPFSGTIMGPADDYGVLPSSTCQIKEVCAAYKVSHGFYMDYDPGTVCVSLEMGPPPSGGSIQEPGAGWTGSTACGWASAPATIEPDCVPVPTNPPYFFMQVPDVPPGGGYCAYEIDPPTPTTAVYGCAGPQNVQDGRGDVTVGLDFNRPIKWAYTYYNWMEGDSNSYAAITAKPITFEVHVPKAGGTLTKPTEPAGGDNGGIPGGCADGNPTTVPQYVTPANQKGQVRLKLTEGADIQVLKIYLVYRTSGGAVGVVDDLALESTGSLNSYRTPIFPSVSPTYGVGAALIGVGLMSTAYSAQIWDGGTNNRRGGMTVPSQCQWYWGEKVAEDSSTEHDEPLDWIGQGGVNPEVPPEPPTSPPDPVDPEQPGAGCGFSITSPSTWLEGGICLIADGFDNLLDLVGSLPDLVSMGVYALLLALIGDALLSGPPDLDDDLDDLKTAYGEKFPFTLIQALPGIAEDLTTPMDKDTCDDLTFDTPAFMSDGTPQKVVVIGCDSGFVTFAREHRTPIAGLMILGVVMPYIRALQWAATPILKPKG